MTETRVEARVVSAVSNVLGNGPLEEAMEAEMERLGPPLFDEADRAFAREIQATLTPEDIADAFRRTGRRPVADQPLCDFDRAARAVGRQGAGVDGCGRRVLGGADGAGAGRDLRHRHAVPFLAADRAGQERRRPTRAWCMWPR